MGLSAKLIKRANAFSTDVSFLLCTLCASIRFLRLAKFVLVTCARMALAEEGLKAGALTVLTNVNPDAMLTAWKLGTFTASGKTDGSIDFPV